jgi:hypothetical protein
MQTIYHTFEQEADDFTERHQLALPSPRTCLSRPCTRSLALRFFLRNTVPLIFGIAAGIGAKKTENHITGSENKPIVCDIVSGMATLIIAYTMDLLLNCCWPLDPYLKNHLFQPISHSLNTTETAIQADRMHAP